MWLSTMISEGRSGSLCAALIATSSSPRSLTSLTRCTFQCQPSKRVATSSLKASEVRRPLNH